MRDRKNRNDPGPSDEDYLAFLRGTPAPARPQPSRPQPPRPDPARPGSPTRAETAAPGRQGRHRSTRRLSRPLLLGTAAAATLIVLIGAGVALAPRIAGPAGDGDGAVPLLDVAEASAVAPDATPGATATPTAAVPRRSRSPRPSAPAPTTAPPPAPPPPAPTATGSGDGYADERAAVLALVNTERAKAGCGSVSAQTRLDTAAQRHSKDQAAHQDMSHTGSDGSSVGTRVTRAGYTWRAVGENVAMGYRTPEAVMQGWMNSPGHRQNILNCTYKHLGVGVAKGGGALYWTQVFATPS